MSPTPQELAALWLRDRSLTLREAADRADLAYSNGDLSAAAKYVARKYREAAAVMDDGAAKIEANPAAARASVAGARQSEAHLEGSPTTEGGGSIPPAGASLYLGITSDGDAHDTEPLDATTLDEAERECPHPDRDSGLPPKPGFEIIDADNDVLSVWDGLRWARTESASCLVGAGR